MNKPTVLKLPDNNNSSNNSVLISNSNSGLNSNNANSNNTNNNNNKVNVSNHKKNEDNTNAINEHENDASSIKLNANNYALLIKFQKINENLNVINKRTQTYKSQIETHANKLVELINEQAFGRHTEIENLRVQLINQIRMDANELVNNFKFKNDFIEHDDKTRHLIDNINNEYESITNELLTKLGDKRATQPAIQDENNNYNNQIDERLNILNSDINSCFKNMVADPTSSLRQAELGARFVPSNSNINITFLGDVTYDPEYFRIDTSTKVRLLNNDFQYKHVDLTPLIKPITTKKCFQLISRDKILLIHEKLLGRVRMTYLKMVYYSDLSVIHEAKCENTTAFLSKYAYYDSKYILLSFEFNSEEFYIALYDCNLTELKTQKIYHEIEKIIMTENRFYLIRNRGSKIIHEFSYDFSAIDSFGQSKHKKKKFYIPGEVFAIENDKIYTKLENKVLVYAKSSGNVLNQFEMDDLITSHIFLDFCKEKFLVFNGYQKLSYYNHNGELINFNKIRLAEKFDEFQFIKTGYFAFINNQKNFILII